MPTPNASRVGDGIEHTNAFLGALTGIAIGLAIGVAVAVAGVLTVATGGLALAVIGGLAAICTGIAAGFSFGELIGSMSSSKSGVIGEGAKTVFIGAGLPPAARAKDKLACGDPPITTGKVVVAALLGPLAIGALGIYSLVRSDHGGAMIATGSETVFIGGRNAARIEDETNCSGKIIEGAKTVGIGGRKVDVIDRRSWRPEIPEGLRTAVTWIDRAGVVLGLLSGVGAIRVLGWKAARPDFLIAAGDVALFGAETASRSILGDDSNVTKGLAWTRTVYETAAVARTGRNLLRTGPPDLPSAPRVTTPDAPSAPRVSVPDAPSAPRVSTPDVPTPAARPVPQGGQTIPERMGQGGNPPPYARQNPDNYYYDPAAGRYKRR